MNTRVLRRMSGWRAASRRTAARSPLPHGLLELARMGATPLAPVPQDPGRPLDIAVVIPSFRRGSGGHSTIVRVLLQLRELGHSVSLWLEDHEGRHAREPASVTKRSFEEFFGAEGLDLNLDFRAWKRADVVMATAWQTVPRALLLPGAGSRAYLVQDHEPDFYGASAEALFAAASYRQGLYCIAASQWLAELLNRRYDVSASSFDLGVDHTVYRPTGERRDNLVVFYARAVTPRRAVPLGLLALEELVNRRPDVEVGLFGEDRPLPASFPHTNLGVLPPSALARLYSQATAGMVFSLTNPSLTGLEMMACGLPCVELRSEPMLATFGSADPLILTDADPLRLCQALERLLDDPGERARRSERGVALMQERTWRRAGSQIEQALRQAVASAGGEQVEA